MMRRIDLLPAKYRARRRERRTIGLMFGAALLLGAGLVAWWFLLGSSVDDERNNLSAVQAQNASLQADIGELQRFANLDSEVQTKRGALQTVMVGDIAWPSILTEIAMVIPGEVWLDGLTASAGITEGASSVGTETAPVRIADVASTGRIQFTGQSTSMPGVARWLVRLATVDSFSAVWLNSAIGGVAEGSAQSLFSFDSTIELGPEALSRRFEGDIP